MNHSPFIRRTGGLFTGRGFTRRPMSVYREVVGHPNDLNFFADDLADFHELVILEERHVVVAVLVVPDVAHPFLGRGFVNTGRLVGERDATLGRFRRRRFRCRGKGRQQEREGCQKYLHFSSP